MLRMGAWLGRKTKPDAQARRLRRARRRPRLDRLLPPLGHRLRLVLPYRVPVARVAAAQAAVRAASATPSSAAPTVRSQPIVADDLYVPRRPRRGAIQRLGIDLVRTPRRLRSASRDDRRRRRRRRERRADERPSPPLAASAGRVLPARPACRASRRAARGQLGPDLDADGDRGALRALRSRARRGRQPLVGVVGQRRAHTMPAAPSATGRPPAPPMSVADPAGAHWR